MAPLERRPDGHPARLEAMAVYASVVQRLGRDEEALAEYDHLIELQGKRPETAGEELAMLESNAAECLLGLGRLPLAQQRFDLALRALEQTPSIARSTCAKWRRRRRRSNASRSSTTRKASKGRRW